MGWGSLATETIVNTAAAAAFAGACAFAIGAAGTGAGSAAVPIAVFGIVFFGAAKMLRRSGASNLHVLPAFSLEPIVPIAPAPDELLLAELYESQSGELLLDDPLPQTSPDERVVRLFAAGPPRAQKPADASEALRQALTELRRSLR